jgi:alpha-L-fucosidase 2
LLPALPDAWKTGSVKGLKARGGFEVDIEWNGGEITKAVIQSSLGGNCRIRSYVPLKGKGLKEATGVNTNPFYQVADIKTPLNHAESKVEAPSLKKVYEYDIAIGKGKTVELTK